MSQPAARTTRGANQKPAQKAAQTKAPARSRGAAKKRTESDENADVPELSSQAGDDDEVVVLHSTPVKRSSPVKSEAKTVVESEGSMSSRATTPAGSPAPS